MAGINEYTVLMLHCNGTDTSTDFPDSSPSEHTVTANGTAQVDTSYSKFGGASLLLDGNSDYLSVPDSSDWDFGTGDFCIDFWMRWTGANWDNKATFSMGLYNAGIDMISASGGSGIYARIQSNNTTDTTTPTKETWTHVAVTRESGTVRQFIGGALRTTNTITASIAVSLPFIIGGKQNSGPTVSFFFNGHFDEFRVQKGEAYYTSAFTPPTSAYSPDAVPRSHAVII